MKSVVLAHCNAQSNTIRNLRDRINQEYSHQHPTVTEMFPRQCLWLGLHWLPSYPCRNKTHMRNSVFIYCQNYISESTTACLSGGVQVNLELNIHRLTVISYSNSFRYLLSSQTNMGGPCNAEQKTPHKVSPLVARPDSMGVVHRHMGIRALRLPLLS